MEFRCSKLKPCLFDWRHLVPMRGHLSAPQRVEGVAMLGLTMGRLLGDKGEGADKGPPDTHFQTVDYRY